MNKITWCGEAQSPYNDFLLSEINKVFELEVFYKIKKINSHPWKLKDIGYNINYINNNFFKALKSISSSDIVVISGWSFWQHLVIMFIPFRSVKKVYWTDTPNLDKKKWTGIKGYSRKLISKLVFHIFDEVWSTGKPGYDALVKLGCKISKIKTLPFFLDLTRYNNISHEKNNKAFEFRKKYSNTDTEIIFLCMGQIIPRK
jgi:hypothetical protein